MEKSRLEILERIKKYREGFEYYEKVLKELGSIEESVDYELIESCYESLFEEYQDYLIHARNE